MGTLVRHVSALSAVGYGINIWETQPVTPIRGNSANTIGMVGALPWGPVDEPVLVTTPADFFAHFYPSAFGPLKDWRAYPAILALLNKPLFTRGGLRVVRVGATGHAYAEHEFGTSVAAVARHPGAYGNQVKVGWGDDGEMIVAVGSSYLVRYPGVAVGGVVTDPGDPYVAVEALPGASGAPAAAAPVALSGGSDGAAVAGDFTAAIGGLYGSAAPDVAFVAECPAALINQVNAALKAWAEDNPGGLAVLSTVPEQSKSDAMTYAPDYKTGNAGRTTYHWPRVKTVNGFDPNQAPVTVDGNAFAAAAIANVDPWISPGGAGKQQGAQDLLSGIVGLEDESAGMVDLDLLNDAGVAPWFVSRALGVIIRKGVTTSTEGRVKIAARRMTDYLTSSIAGFAEQFVERPLDINLDDRELGENTGSFVGSVVDFLQREQDAGHIRAFVVEPYSGNTQADIDEGRWTVIVAVKLMSSADEIVLMANIGETVEITE